MFTDHIHDQLGKYRVGIISDIMPDFVKEAEEKTVSEDLTKLADGCFAYSDGVNRYFPIHTPEHTWMSHAYFEKFASEFEEQTRKEISNRIQDAFAAFELPENSIVKIAAEEDEIDAIQFLSTEMNKFINNYKKLPISMRREKAQEIMQKAFSLSRHKNMHELIKRYAGHHLHKNYESAFGKRMGYFHVGAPERTMLLEMQEDAKNHVPEKVALALCHFDEKCGLHKLYDNELDDPYLSVLSPDYEEESLDFDGMKVLPSALRSYDYSMLDSLLSDSLIGHLKENPIEALRSAHPHIRAIVIRKVNTRG